MRYSFIFLIVLLSCTTFAQESKWKYSDGKFNFEWDLQADKAKLESAADSSFIWGGSLLPAFWIQQAPYYLKPTVCLPNSVIRADNLSLQLDFGRYGKGQLTAELKPWGISFSQLSIKWAAEIPAIIEMYFGTSALTAAQMATVPDTERPFWPDWSAFGYCIPGAKEGPAQSYFRNWDFGQADIALGSFGPSMGSPYGAAFPRPVLAASMGYNNGWITFGAGSLPDAAMTFKVRSGHGCIQYLYREDLWGAAKQTERVWNNPLKITFGENAWVSMRKYIHAIPDERTLPAAHHKAIWNTWGNWKMQEYAIPPIADFARKTGAEILVLDDPWESSQGTGTHSKEKFPHFFDDINKIHNLKMKHGIWESLGWIDEPESLGLTKEDLMLDKNGNLCKGSWNFDPLWQNHYILDISTDHARNFLIERTKKAMKEVKPALIKLDFGYGIPNANVGVPRDPNIRGERYSYVLAKTITDAAKSIDPNVTILYYGISPFFQLVSDMLSLDDQGDLWYAHADGHDQWSIWASLLSQRHIALNGSSGYDWSSDDEILLNTAILGSPGSVLPNHLKKAPVPDAFVNRRYALNTWYRRTIQWEPVWYNTDIGGMETPMQINCWGRKEEIEGKKVITALALRERNKKTLGSTMLEGFTWSGRWALIAIDNSDIHSSKELAVIPFDNSTSLKFPFKNKPVEVRKVSYQSSEAYSAWTWKDGVMTIDFARGSLASTAGFVIKSK